MPTAEEVYSKYVNNNSQSAEDIYQKYTGRELPAQLPAQQPKVSTQSFRPTGVAPSTPVNPKLHDTDRNAVGEAIQLLGNVTNATTKESVEKLEQKYSSKLYDSGWLGQIRAQFGIGKISQAAMKAWNDYLDNPTRESWDYVQRLDELEKSFNINNQDVLGAEPSNKIQDWANQYANYLPQLIDQTKVGLPLSLPGAAIGGVVGYGMGEVSTPIPILDGVAGTAIGIVKGYGYGSAFGSAANSYQSMRGGAAKNLFPIAKDAQTAANAATDEGLVSSVIELGDNIKDVLMWTGGVTGITGKLAETTLFKGISNAAATKAITAVLDNAAFKYLSDTIGEGHEEVAQEIISIANERRVSEGKGNGGVNELLDYVMKVISDGSLKEEDERLWESWKGGVVIGAIGNAAHVAGGYAVREAELRGVAKMDTSELTARDLNYTNEKGLEALQDSLKYHKTLSAEQVDTINRNIENILEKELS